MRQLTIEDFLEYLNSLEAKEEQQSEPANIDPILALEQAMQDTEYELSRYYRSDRSPTGRVAEELAESLDGLVQRLLDVARSGLLPIKD